MMDHNNDPQEMLRDFVLISMKDSADCMNKVRRLWLGSRLCD